MNIIAGAFFLASSNISLKRFSDSPTYLLTISGPLIAMKYAPASFATALANKVLPVPGGP